MFKFFGKLTVICNLCFAGVLVWRYWQQQKPLQAASEALRLQPLESTLAILGYGAIFINFLFHLWVIARRLLNKQPVTNRWLVVFNGGFLLLQCYFFFF
jgi:hypothetical protein